MVSKKSKNKDIKSKTKLKKRKLEKHKRKQDEKKFVRKNRDTIISVSIIIAIIIISVICYTLYMSNAEKNSIVDYGDEVKFNFISYYDTGDIIQHTIVSNPSDVTIDTSLDDNRLKNPQRLIIGGFGQVQGLLIPLFWNDELFINMKKNEYYYISIPAEDAYGVANRPFTTEQRIFNVPRKTSIDKLTSINIDDFTTEFGEPEIGMELIYEENKVSVASFDEEFVIIERNYEQGDEVYLEYGKATVTEALNDGYEVFYIGEKDITFFANYLDIWVPVHIMDITEDELIIETEHFNYKIYIDSIDKNVIDDDDWTISDGDYVTVRYIGYYEDGEVFDSSIIEDIELTKDLPLDDTFKHNALMVTVQPGNVISGTTSVITGFNDALKGMADGEEKTIEVPPEKGYGEYDQELVEEIDLLVGEYDLVETIQKIQTFSLEEYMLTYTDEPYLGAILELEYGTGTIISFDENGIVIELSNIPQGPFSYHNVSASVIGEDEDTIIIQHIVEEGDRTYVQGGGLATIHLNENTFYLKYDPDDFSIGGSFANGKIIDITEDHITIDNNNPMAGKTLFFKIKVMDFKKVV